MWRAKNYNCDSALHSAVGHGNAKATELLLGAGADLHSRDMFGNTPLHAAAEYGSVEVLQLLLAAGAEPNRKNTDGNTALHRAVNCWDDEILQQLLDDGRVNLNQTNLDGETALHCAARIDSPECTALLLQLGANGRVKNRAGDTVFDVARGHGAHTHPGLAGGRGGSLATGAIAPAWLTTLPSPS